MKHYWFNNLWRPTAGMSNRIRILPALNKEYDGWYLRVDEHFVPLIDYKRSYVCNNQLFGEIHGGTCPLCKMKNKFLARRKFKEAKYIETRKYALLNIIDRANEEAGVRSYKAPISVWRQIDHKISGEAKELIDYFDISPDLKLGRDYWMKGHDLEIFYDPEKDFRYRYMVRTVRRDPCLLGTEEQREKWMKQAILLDKYELYSPVKEMQVKFLDSQIEEEAYKNKYRERRQVIFAKIYNEPIFNISSKLRKDGFALIESLDRYEDVGERWMEWLENWHQEKRIWSEKVELVKKIMKIEGHDVNNTSDVKLKVNMIRLSHGKDISKIKTGEE